MLDISKFKKQNVIGQGSFGKVYKAIDQDGKTVAIKNIKFDPDQEGIPASALRQISLLKKLNGHPNIVQLIGIDYKAIDRSLDLVFEYYQYDLKKFMHYKQVMINQTTVKTMMKKILNGVKFCHSKKIMHRDIKPQNILVDKQINVKIADFGLARLLMQPNPQLTPEIQTIYYRAPQLLLGDERYTYAVDIWAIGCIFLQMWWEKPFFRGDGSQIQQVFQIFQILGTPNQKTVSQIFRVFPNFKHSFPKWQKQDLRKILPWISPLGIQFAQALLELDPKKRLTAAQAMEHKYLQDILL